MGLVVFIFLMSLIFILVTIRSLQTKNLNTPRNRLSQTAHRPIFLKAEATLPQDIYQAPYIYQRKSHIITRSESKMLTILEDILRDSRFFVYPQIHLDTFLDHKIKGQNWQAALSTIQRKSVDFLICDSFNRPLIAIELDDISHLRADRVERDNLVESICKSANMPLLRIRKINQYDTVRLKAKLVEVLGEF